MKKIFTLCSILLLTLSASAQTYNGGTWYSLVADKEITNVVVNSKIDEWNVFSPTAGSVSFDCRKLSGLTINGDVEVQTSADGSNYSEAGKVSYYDKTYRNSSVSIPRDIVKMRFMNRSTGSMTKNVRVVLANHILLTDGSDAGTKFGKSSINKTFETTQIGEAKDLRVDFRSFLSSGNITVTLTEGDAEVFRLGSKSNTTGSLTSSTAGKSYNVGANACASANGSAAQCASGQLAKIDNYAFSVYFSPKEVDTYKGKITITDGTNTATVTLSGAGIKRDQTITWEIGDSINYGEAIPLATASSGLPVEYTPYDPDILVYEDGQFIFTGAGEVTIEASQPGNDQYNAAEPVERTIYIVPPTTYGEFVATACQGEEIEFNDKIYTETTKTQVLFGQNYLGGDSIVTLNITFNPSYNFPEQMTIAYGDAETWQEQDLSEIAVGEHMLDAAYQTIHGCDSVYTLALTVTKQTTLVVPVALDFCEGGSADFRGEEYTESGLFDIPVVGAVRDTLYQLTVTVLQPSFSYEEMTMAFGEDSVWNGIALNDSTIGEHTVVYVTTNELGCDSTVTLALNVTKQQTLVVPMALDFCEGGSADFRGEEYTESGSFDIPVVGAVRDTLYQLTVTVLQPSFSYEEMTMAFGEDSVWNGIALNDSTIGEHTVVYVTTNELGCDSTVTLALTVTKQPTLQLNYAIDFCQGDSAEYMSKWYYDAGEDSFEITGDVRDTVYNITISVLPTDYLELSIDSLVVGDTLLIGDEMWYMFVNDEWTLMEDTAYVMELEQSFDLTHFGTNVDGCDSIVVRHVVVAPKPQQPGTTTGVETLDANPRAVKILRDGVLYIRRGENYYMIDGKRVEL